MTTTTAPLNETDLTRLTAEELDHLYRSTKAQLGARRLTAMDNANVLTVRLPADVVATVKRLAFQHQTTRSAILRAAITKFINLVEISNH